MKVAVNGKKVAVKQKPGSYKADKSRSAAGYGIGLSICKSICTLFKTELKFESELGRGTCVSFDLEVTE